MKPQRSLKEQRKLIMGENSTTYPINFPIPDPDPFYATQKTFLVLNRNKLIFRFSKQKSLFLFDDKNNIRLAFIRLLVDPYFNGVVIATILINMLVMMINGNEKYEWSETYVENIFTFIYTVEAITKIVGRGFIFHQFSYLRDPWNWLDFVVIVAAYVLIIIDHVSTMGSGSLSSLTFLRVIRVLRVIKTVSVIPGLRMIVTALIESTKALKDALLLSLLGFSMFSLMGIQLFRGALLGKCVLKPPWMISHHENVSISNASFYNHTSSSVTRNRDIIFELFGDRVLQEMYFLENETEYFVLYENSSAEIGQNVTALSAEISKVFSNKTTTYPNNSFTNNSRNLPTQWNFKRVFDITFNPLEFTFDWNRWANDKNHYVMNGPIPKLCGNGSTAISCPDITLCLKVGENPNFGYTSFDNFLYAFLSVFRLSMQDNWEELYLQILETAGTITLPFFLALIFLGSYYLVNLILAVVAFSYESQRKQVENAVEEEKKQKMQENILLQTRRNAHASNETNSIRRKMSLAEKTCCCWHAFKSLFLLWTCCVGQGPICRFRAALKRILEKSNAELFTVSLVILNTIVMGLEHEPKKEWFEDFMHYSNLFFTSLFTIEVVLKLFAFNVIQYFSVTWNVFDFIVVSLSLIEIFLSDYLPDGLAALRTFRLIRLVRILKLARAWPTFSKLMKMVADSLKKIGYLTLVLLIVLVIFALAGMQTVGTAFYMDTNRGIPLRWHMNDFPHAFLVVFRIQCGEWIQSMWSCMHSVSVNGNPSQIPVCVFIFLGVVFVGNLVVLNLFLALLLNSFSSEALSSGSGKSKNTKKFISSLKKAGKSIKKPKLVKKISGNKSRVRPSQSSSASPSPRLLIANSTQQESDSVSITNNNGNHMNERIKHEHTIKLHNKNYSGGQYLNILPDIHKLPNTVDIKKATKVAIEPTYRSEPRQNFHQIISSKNVEGAKVPFQQKFKKHWTTLQKRMNAFVTNSIFETIIIFMILLSSSALAFEDVHLHEKPTLKLVLGILDKVFTVVFFIEMIMKWIGFGWKKYFTDGWCVLDAFIVLISIISLSMEIHASVTASEPTDISSLRVLRSLRALRPLRAMSRFKGIKVVTDALFRSIPSIMNVLFICLVFWLVFAIMGISLFAGKMASCRYRETGEKVWHPADFERYKDLKKYYEPSPINVTSKEDCLHLANITGGKVLWKNLYVNFDNVGISYVALLQVATFKGWMPIMYAAVDAPDAIGMQPQLDNNIANYLFFVAFIIFGAFFTLNLFISVVIDSFNQQKKKFELDGGELFLTETQKKAYNAMKNLTARTPSKLFIVPKHVWRQKLYLFVTGEIFELGVMVVTLLNLVVMALEYEGISKELSETLEYINYAFVGMFTVENILRMTASGLGYFQVPWNVFDFLLITGSLIANLVALINYEDGSHVSVTASPWLPLLRMIRIARILRVARVASGVRTLLFALMLSLPALINVGSLLFLVMFIFSIFGMSQFSSIEHKGAITDILNFETFPNAFMLLFQASTSAGWDGFMEPMLYTAGEDSDCGNIINGKNSCMDTTAIGYIFFVSYLLITFVIITNMYIAIILENFDLATRDSAEPLTADDFEHFFDEWQRHDHEGEGKLSVYELSDFLNSIDVPLQIKQPNMKQISEMAIPLDDKGKLHIFDVACALITRILGPEVFTDDIRSEVEEHFRHKAKNLMRNYQSSNSDKTTANFIDIVEETKKEQSNLTLWKRVKSFTSQKSDDVKANLNFSSRNNSNNSSPGVILKSSKDAIKCAAVLCSPSLKLQLEPGSENSNNNASSENSRRTFLNKLNIFTYLKRHNKIRNFNLFQRNAEDIKTNTNCRRLHRTSSNIFVKSTSKDFLLPL